MAWLLKEQRMDPITIGAIVGGVSMLGGSIMSYLESQESARISAKERQKLYELAMATEDPNFNMSTITPEQFRAVEAFVPAAVPFIAEQAPEVIQKNAEMKEARGAQMDTLRYLQQMAREGKDPIAEMDRLKGARLAAQEASTQRANIQAGMGRRGVGIDSGLSLGMQQQAAGDAGYRTAMAGEQAARDALERRGQAASQAASIGGQVFGQEADIEARNVNAINAFNQRMAERRQQLAQLNVGGANQAAMAQRANEQAIANMNVQARNAAAVGNLDRENDLKQRVYQNRLGKTATAMGAGEAGIRGMEEASRGRQRAWAGAGQGLATLASSYGRMPKKPKVEEDEEYDEEYV
jgi:hypothetical protein